MKSPVPGRAKGIMVAATMQHTGKTSVSMSLLSGLRRIFGPDRVAYMKPVGQRHVEVDGHKVENDVRATWEYFQMRHCAYRDMSPVVIDRGYTRRYLDGLVSFESQVAAIKAGYQRLSEANDFIVVEGTGHVGVGSIIGLNNARVARELGLDMILVSNGGLGSAFDQLELNRQLCIANGVNLRGIILNKVDPEKYDMVRAYTEKAFSQWGVPLLGCVPNKVCLDSPSIMDLERLFGVSLLSGQQHGLRRFKSFELVTTSLRRFMEKLISPSQSQDVCWITHSSRNDIVLGVLNHASSRTAQNQPCGGAMILTGSPPSRPHHFITEYIKAGCIPVINVPLSTADTMRRIESYTAKMDASDRQRTQSVIDHYEPYIDFHTLVNGAATATNLTRFDTHSPPPSNHTTTTTTTTTNTTSADTIAITSERAGMEVAYGALEGVGVDMEVLPTTHTTGLHGKGINGSSTQHIS